VTVNEPELVAVPPGVVTEIGPDFAPCGTSAVICVDETTVNDALLPLNATDVAPVKPVPVIVTVVFAGPLVGVNDEIVGAAVAVVTVKLDELVPVPADVVTEIGPVVAPLGTVVEIDVSETTVKDALVPLKRTAAAPVKPVPETVTLVPTGPLVGLKDETVGAAVAVVTMKLDELVAVPPDVVTEIGPVVAPFGTVAEIDVSDETANVALVPLNVTDDAPVKLLPEIVTLVPGGPLVGLNDEIDGAAGVVDPQFGNLNEPIRVFQSSCASVVGRTS
jgi:hypothetical protein